MNLWELIATAADRIEFARLITLHRRGKKAIRKWQDKYIARLVLNAAVRIPAYGALLKARGVDPHSVRGVDDMPRLPVISKDFFIGKAVHEYIDPELAKAGRWFHTSGTSGKPLTLLVNPLVFNQFYLDSTIYRFLMWDRSIFSTNTARIVKIDFRNPRQKNTLFFSVESFRKYPETVMRTIVAYRPDVIGSYTSTMLDIARYVKENRLPLKVRYATVYGEMLYPEARKQIEESLGAEVYNRYGMGETGGAVALECRFHDGMHINSELIVVEIVHENGTRVPEGKEGRVLVTDLFNYGMPFIRYETGDRGRISHEPCQCGLKTPRLWIEGRYSAHLTVGKSRIHHLEFDAALDSLMNVIVQFHIVKTAEDALLVEIVPGRNFTDAHKDEIRSRISAIAGGEISVEVKTVELIERSARGKSLIISDRTIKA